jgi:hypothetical protein
MKSKIDVHQPFGKILKQLKERSDYRDAQLAKEVGASKNHLNEVIAGRVEMTDKLQVRTWKITTAEEARVLTKVIESICPEITTTTKKIKSHIIIKASLDGICYRIVKQKHKFFFGRYIKEKKHWIRLFKK